MANYYVKLGGLRYLMRIGRFTFYTQRVRFYSQSEELEAEFNITISNLDFALYDSYWLKDTRFFRPTLEGIAEEGRLKREKKRQEWEKKKKEELIKQKKREHETAKNTQKFRVKMKELVEVLERIKLEAENKGLGNEEKIKDLVTKKTKENKQIKKKRKCGKSPLQEFLKNHEKRRKE
jgi:hypothetical protein